MFCVRKASLTACRIHPCGGGKRTCQPSLVRWMSGRPAHNVWKRLPQRGFLVRCFGGTPQMYHMKSLRARQPRKLLQNDVFLTTPPEDLEQETLETLAEEDNLIDPSKVLKIYSSAAAQDDIVPVSVAIRAFVQLGFLFDPNSFFSTADRQRVTSSKAFRKLAYDLTTVQAEIPDAASIVLLYSMACLEYRCAPLLPPLLDAVEANVTSWRTEALSLALHSLVSLGFARGEISFDVSSGERSRDYGHVVELLAAELGRRAFLHDAATNSEAVVSGASEDESDGPHDWARAAFAMVMADMYDLPSACGNGPVLPALLANACAAMPHVEDVDESGWAQFFIYQTLYCADVEKPATEFEIKRAVPMWMQERLHERWLDSIVLHAQPQGTDDMQRDVEASLRRTNTQALLNCSVGRDWDEQHCWFAGFLLEPKIALECDALLPLGAGRPLVSGWLALKSRVLRKMGYTVVTLHRSFWDPLTEDQKDEQILRLRAQVGYLHDKEREKRQKPIRQTPYTYKGLESKRKAWNPQGLSAAAA